jgi:hypothetical protein
MKLINFVPPQIREKQIRNRTIGASAVAALLAAVGVGALWFSFSFEVNTLNVKADVQKVNVKKTVAKDLITPDILSREASLAQLSSSDVDWGKAFKLVGTILQKDVQLTAYTYVISPTAAALTLTGTAPNNFSFATFLASLNASSTVNGVKVGGYSFSPQKQTVTFGISANVPLNLINYPATK